MGNISNLQCFNRFPLPFLWQICDPPVSVYKGYSMPKDTEEYLLSCGLKNALYSIRAADLTESLFGALVPCPFQVRHFTKLCAKIVCLSFIIEVYHLRTFGRRQSLFTSAFFSRRRKGLPKIRKGTRNRVKICLSDLNFDLINHVVSLMQD